MGQIIKILVVSNSPWNDNNSFGNSFSNIFGGNENYKIANIYCQAGEPLTSVATRFFQITEIDIIKSIIERKYESGHIVKVTPSGNNAHSFSSRQDGIMRAFKKKRWQILFWLRDIIWATRGWKSKSLDNFIMAFNPDIIFQPIYLSSYVNEIGIYAAELVNKPMIGYITDDCVTLKFFSYSLFAWIDRMIKAKYAKRAIEKCELVYTITEKQQKEYDEIFGKGKCKVLFKGALFGERPTLSIHNPLNIVYTGNIGSGRWKTLAAIAKSLSDINNDSTKAFLHIYSATPLTNNMRRALNIAGSSKFEGCVPVSEIPAILENSDILVHAESFDKSEKYSARLSFSTKIVDYLAAGRCILAVGWDQTAGLEYLKDKDAAVVVTDLKQMTYVLTDIVSNEKKIVAYAEKAYDCGRIYHQLDSIREGLYNDILKFI